MKPNSIIPAFYNGGLKDPETVPFLRIAEFFSGTIQGEGMTVGIPSAFLRLQGCTLNCSFCDTQEVWKIGNPYTFEEIVDLMLHHKLIEQFKGGLHLVVTGGSPLNQQDALILFFNYFNYRFGFVPIIEIENECTILPKKDLINLVTYWNNSPKLCSSGNVWLARYKPHVIKALAELTNSTFKFVIVNEQDWREVSDDYIKAGLIKRSQIILMPQGSSRDELAANKEFVLELAVNEQVRYTPRLHIEYWDKKVGI